MGEFCRMRSEIGGEPAQLASPVDFRSLYRGWMKVEHSMMDRMDEYRIENQMAFAGGWVAVQQCSWSQPIENVWSTCEDCYVLDLSLDSRKSLTTAEFVGQEGTAEPELVGPIYMVPPGQTVQLWAKRGQARSLRCFLDADLVRRHLVEQPIWDHSSPAMRDMFHLGGGQIEWLLRRMYKELHEPDFAAEAMIENLASQLAVEIVRRFKLRETKPGYQIGGLAPWRMRLIRERVYSDLPVPNLEELANLCDMTVRHLSRAFRTETGQTVGKYVEAAMAERARTLLGTGTSVREVAADLGYATSGSFSCAFRRATGLLPRDVKAIRAN